MTLGRVNVWTPDPAVPLGGRVAAAVIPLERLDTAGELSGRYVRVRNAGAIHEPNDDGVGHRAVAIGNAAPDADGNFIFERGRGGSKIHTVAVAEASLRHRFRQASHYGETNTYYHLDKIAAHVDALLVRLGAPSLPRIIAVVNAHHGCTDHDGIPGGVRDGVRRRKTWVPFQGGHYRLASRINDIVEHEPVSVEGEIHLGPGREALEHGALAESAGRRYRANAAHNGGILYHEYGHHISRHTADLRANRQRRPDRQDNIKTALDEGTCDYWAATMMDTPHIWAWHRQHDTQIVHERSLCSGKTMADFDPTPGADPHANGTIWGAALWDLRCALSAEVVDLLVVQMMLVLGAIERAGVDATMRAKESYGTALAALLRADEQLNNGRNAVRVAELFARRAIAVQHEELALREAR
jgi:hypothetical protein